MSVYPKSIQRQAVRHTQLQIQVTMLSQCFSRLKYLVFCISSVSPCEPKAMPGGSQGELSSQLLCLCLWPSLLLAVAFLHLYLCVCICVQVHRLLMQSGGQLTSAVTWRFPLEGVATNAPSQQVAAGNGQALSSPKCSTFLWFTLPEIVETQACIKNWTSSNRLSLSTLCSQTQE